MGVVPESDTGEHVALPEMSTLSGALRSVLDSFRWDDRHRRLAAHPLFARCSRAEIRRMVRAGDEVDIAAGEVIAHQDTIGYWFFAVYAGTLALSRDNSPIATIGPGSHVGDIAILGFGPQPATITASTAARLFVIGRRDFLSIAYNTPALQDRLFPGITAEGFRDYVRNLWVEADAAWKRLPRESAKPTLTRAEAALRHFQPGRTNDAGSFSRLAARAFHQPDTVTVSSATPGLSRRTRLTILASATTAAVVVVTSSLFLYHPPVVVVTAGRTIDVARDITVDGAKVHPPSGRYLLTPVRYDQPSLFQAAVAVVTGETTVPLESSTVDRGSITAIEEGQQLFRETQQTVAERALLAAGHDPARVKVVFTRRSVQGSSAGLVYALALADMLDGEDLARGRTIAATGAVDADGRVLPVAFVWIKAEGVKRTDATMFLVPPTQAALAIRSGREVREVKTVDDAISLLRNR